MKPTCGIYGGSFNPIHLGHTRLGQSLCDLELVSQLWFMVSPLNPFKQGDTSLLPDRARLALAHLAVQNDPRLHVSDFEMHLPQPSYMVHTLTRLRHERPDLEFILVIGADNWLRFPQWHQADEILRHHKVIVYPRPGFPVNASTLPSGVTLAPTPLIPISSTQIRHAIAQGTCSGQGLAPQVWQEIQRNGYYL